MKSFAGFEVMKVVAEAAGVGFWVGARADLAQDEEGAGVDGWRVGGNRASIPTDSPCC